MAKYCIFPNCPAAGVPHVIWHSPSRSACAKLIGRRHDMRRWWLLAGILDLLMVTGLEASDVQTLLS